MSELPTTRSTTDALWRWLVGGLVGGALVLGLLVAAYAIGYHRGAGDTGTAAAPAAPVSSASTTTAAPASTSTLGPVGVTAALVARGNTLFRSDGCSACHSLSGADGVGPSLEGLAGSTRTLADGRQVLVDDAYLEQSIADPDAQIAKGYRAGVMPAATASFDLAGNPDDVRALVAFVKSRR